MLVSDSPVDSSCFEYSQPARARGSEAHHKRQQNGLQFAVGDKSEVKL